jgi:hypothetical protein
MLNALAGVRLGLGAAREMPVAGRPDAAGPGALAFDLLTEDEERDDRAASDPRFEVKLIGPGVAAGVASLGAEWGRRRPASAAEIDHRAACQVA